MEGLIIVLISPFLSSCQAENERLARILFSVRSADNVGFGDADVFVGGTVVEEEVVTKGSEVPFLAQLSHPFYEDDIGDLADLLPLLLGEEDGGVGAREEFARIAAVENGNTGAIDELIVGAVVNEDDAAGVRIGGGPGSTTRESNFPGRRGRTGVCVASVQWRRSLE